MSSTPSTHGAQRVSITQNPELPKDTKDLEGFWPQAFPSCTYFFCSRGGAISCGKLFRATSREREDVFFASSVVLSTRVPFSTKYSSSPRLLPSPRSTVPRNSNDAPCTVS